MSFSCLRKHEKANKRPKQTRSRRRGTRSSPPRRVAGQKSVSVSYLASTGAGGSEVSSHQVGSEQHEDQHGEQAQQHRAPDPPQILSQVHPGGLVGARSRLLQHYLDHTSACHVSCCCCSWMGTGNGKISSGVCPAWRPPLNKSCPECGKAPTHTHPPSQGMHRLQ